MLPRWKGDFSEPSEGTLRAGLADTGWCLQETETGISLPCCFVGSQGPALPWSKGVCSERVGMKP